MPKSLRLVPLTQSTISPYGTIIERPTEPGDRNPYTSWLGSSREGMTPRLHVNHVKAATLPYSIDTLERHPYSPQVFVPLDVSRYVILVAPNAADGGPDVAGLQGFLAPGNVGIIYRQGVWHAGASVLDRSGCFAVLMWRNDTVDDEEFVSLPHGIEIQA
jgi:ureidoglycolate lyase